jgi:hypothetical protein
MATIVERLEQLRLLHDFNVPVSDDDLHEPEEIADVGFDPMFQLFRNELNAEEEQKIMGFAKQSKAFCDSLIGLGEFIDATSGHPPKGMAQIIP